VSILAGQRHAILRDLNIEENGLVAPVHELGDGRVATIDLLAREAIALAGDDTRAILGITGSPGAGKSTLVDLLLAHIRTAMGDEWVAHIPMDGFHLADTQLDRLGARDRKGAPDTFDAAGYAHLLERVKQEADNPVYVPGFDRTLEQPLAAALVVPPAARLVITEGNYLLLDDPWWTRARRAIDTVWFVASDEHQRVDRLVARHIEFGKTPDEARAWVANIDGRNADLVATTLGKADRVIVNGAAGWSIA
jgi:pantothenate kinase